MPVTALPSFFGVPKSFDIGQIRPGLWQKPPSAAANRPDVLTGNIAEGRANLKEARIASAFLLSITLHLVLAFVLAIPAAYPPIPTVAPLLSVSLAHAPERPATGLEPDSRRVSEPETSVASRNPADVPSRAARFLSDPDLGVLESIPVRIPGSVSLRLHINANGIVERVTVIRNDPAPKELIDGLIAAFGATRLAPALVGDRPSASSIEVTVRFEPGLQAIEADR